MTINIDNTDITGATIDGTTVQEITIDGTTVFTAVTLAVVESFETDLSGWFGDDEQYNLVTSPAGAIKDGSQCLESPYTASSYDIRCTSAATQLQRGINTGEYVRLYFYPGHADDRIMFRCGDGTGSWYRADVDGNDGNLYLYTDSTLETSTTLSLTANTLYYLRFGYRVGTGDVTAQVFEDDGTSVTSEISFTPSTLYSGDTLEIRLDEQTSPNSTYADMLCVET